MTTTVEVLMGVFSDLPPDTDNNATLSSKQWTESFSPIEHEHVTVWDPTRQAIDYFLGPRSNPASGADRIGLETIVSELNKFPQLVSSEGDVTRDFDQNIIPPVALAFSGESAWTAPRRGAAPMSGAPTFWPRSLVGAKRSNSSTKIIDYQMTMSHQEPSLELPVMIGEMKRPRVIRRREWSFEEEASGTTIRLSQELRAYAYEYRCPQVFVFDMRTLVTVQFRALSVEDICNTDCPIDICVIPRKFDRYIPDQCTMQYALYRLAWRGWVRLCATLECTEDRRSREFVRVRRSLVLDGLTRKYKYYSGDPIWLDNRGHEYDIHPNGYRRDFIFSYHPRRNGVQESKGFWVWILGDGTFEEDTSNTFISGYQILP